jgi:two-component system sensor kinase FixL
MRVTADNERMSEVQRTGLHPAAPRSLLAPLPWAVVVGYVLVFLVLDWASFIRPLQGLNITPWNPQPAWPWRC